MKRCNGCEQMKEEDEFHWTKRVYGKLVYRYRRSTCKTCRNDRQKTDRILKKA